MKSARWVRQVMHGGATTIILLAALMPVALIQAGEAQSRAYLKIADIKGTSTAPGHEGEIDVLGWNWGTQTRALSTRGDASSEPGVTTITITKATDLASAPLHQLSTGDKSVDEVTLTVRRKDKEHVVQTLRLEGVTVASIRDVGDGRENVVLKFERVEVKPETLR